MSSADTQFKKGHPKMGGAVKGTVYRGADLKNRIINCLGKQDLEKMLLELYKVSPTKFWDVVIKMCPQGVELSGGEDGSQPLRLIIRGYNGNEGHTSSGSSST